MTAKPTTLPRWSTDMSNMTAPSSGQMDTGWTPNQDGVSDYDNYIKYWTYKWVEWLDAGDVSFQDLSFTGTFKRTGIASKTLPGATTTQNWDVVGSGSNLLHTSVVNVTVGGASCALGGIAGGADGQELLLVNVSGTGFTINREDTGSTAANRITMYDQSALTVVQPGEMVWLRYVGALSRWVLPFTKAEAYGDKLRPIPHNRNYEIASSNIAFDGTTGYVKQSSSTPWVWVSTESPSWNVRAGEVVVSFSLTMTAIGPSSTRHFTVYYADSTGINTVQTFNFTGSLGSGSESFTFTLTNAKVIGSSGRLWVKIDGSDSGDEIRSLNATVRGFNLP